MTLYVRRRKAAKPALQPVLQLVALATAARGVMRPLSRLLERSLAAPISSLAEQLAPGPLPVALALACGIALGEAWGGAVAVSALALAVLLGTWGRRGEEVASEAARPARSLGSSAAVLLAIVAVGVAVERWRGVGAASEEGEAEGAATLEHRGVVRRPALARDDGRFSVELAMIPDGVVVRALTPRPGADEEGRPLRAYRPVPGDELVLTGKLRPPRGARNPGGVNRTAMARADGIERELSAEAMEVVGRDGSWWLAVWRRLDELSVEGSARISGGDGGDGGDGASLPEARAILRGVVLGVRDDIPESVDERWRAVGIYHVLSVSGLHLAVVALFVFTALRRLAAALGSRVEPAAIALVPALLIATAYTLLTGAQVATLRALLVAALWMLGRAMGRPLRLVDALGATAIVLLLWSPAQLGQPSFQLSFAAALGLARHPSAPHDPAWGRLRRWLAALGRGATTSAWIVLITSPITAYHFHQVQPGGVLGNLILTPLVELAALPLGLLGLVVGVISSSVGGALITAAAAVIAVADGLAALLQPWCPVGTVAIAAPLFAVLLWAGTTALCGRRRPGALDAAAWCGLCALWLAAPLAAPDGVRVVFLDVGQGDAALIETASETWLIDAGGAPNAPTEQLAAAPGRAIPRYLELSRRRHIDVAIVSHPHPDHYLGLLALEGQVSIGELWLPPGFVDGEASAASAAGDGATGLPSFAALVERLRRAGTVVREPPREGRLSREGARLTVIAPRYRERAEEPERLAADPVRSINDNSAVATVEYAGRRVLFAGDVELEGEEALIAALPAGALRADVVKVPHHGSRTSSTEAFVAATAGGARDEAALAVISCGAGNRFGFPATEVVERWQVGGARVLRTDRGGAVIVEIDRAGAIAAHRR